MYVARSRAHSQQRSAAVNFAVNLFVHVAHASLHGHFDGLANVDAARTRRNVRIESRIRGQPYMHVAGTGANLPRTGLRALGRYIAAARLPVEAALHATRVNIS